MSDFLVKVVAVLGGLFLVTLIAGALILFGSIITMWAWNVFMVSIFHLPAINFWQAFAFNLLANAFRTIVINKK